MIDSALIENMRDLPALGREVEIFGMRQDEIKRHQTSLDGLELVLAAVAAVFVTDRPIGRPDPDVEYLPIVGEDMPAATVAIEQISEKVIAALAPLDVDPSVGLTAYEVASAQRD